MRLLASMVAMWLAATAVWAQSEGQSNGLSDGQSRAIEGTISAQIEAFQADDFERAFSFASPTIQGIFGSSDNFGRMVRNGYPMVWRPDDVRYLALREVAGAYWKRVMIRDGAGASHMLDYQMIETPEGWKINAVYLIPPQGVNS